MSNIKHTCKHMLDHLQQCGVASALPSLAPTSFEGKQKKEMVVFVGSRNRGANGYEEERADDEEGYRTPTSPSHRIPPMARCPPPPKKLASVSRCRKRSKGSRVRIGGLELMYCTTRKKIRREEE
ncbi:hypothetical protein HPP92_018061 [Vanilla planifolia]|uniref:Uncharacterized protein n=1 Tax=Vanilla planifolia TaxID=51239 RepID=A0A835UP24_VANPL|nr:hypothetical protein HPP92_018061 [Vanilla planifolia]